MIKWVTQRFQSKSRPDQSHLRARTDTGDVLLEPEQLKEFRWELGSLQNLWDELVWTGGKRQGSLSGAEGVELLLVFQESNVWITCKKQNKIKYYCPNDTDFCNPTELKNKFCDVSWLHLVEGVRPWRQTWSHRIHYTAATAHWNQPFQAAANPVTPSLLERHSVLETKTKKNLWHVDTACRFTPESLI